MGLRYSRKTCRLLIISFKVFWKGGSCATDVPTKDLSSGDALEGRPVENTFDVLLNVA